jgi:hypothetical protein
MKEERKHELLDLNRLSLAVTSATVVTDDVGSRGSDRSESGDRLLGGPFLYKTEGSSDQHRLAKPESEGAYERIQQRHSR